MQLGMVGLGRMGQGLARRLMQHDHGCVVYDRDAAAVEALAADGARRAGSLASLVEQLARPRVVWLMLPAAAVDATLDALAGLLQAGDIVVDGGNSHFRDDLRRAQALQSWGIHYVDVGTSGGVRGAGRGYCLMVGAEPRIFEQLRPLFVALTPGAASVSRTRGRKGSLGDEEHGYLLCGPAGAGHFVKMVHNGIEYGMLAAYAEGLNLLRHANLGRHEQAQDAQTAPLREPALYQYDFKLADIAELWRRGSVVSSWLLDLTAAALLRDPELAGFAGHVADTGEGRWALQAATDLAVPVPLLGAALHQRFASRGQADFANRLLSATRHAFGGHAEADGGDAAP
jgi:6-phosphogluconate dehydrogenase